jgi:hypothetical protein
VNQNHERPESPESAESKDERLQLRLQSLRYPETRQDLWPQVSHRIRQVKDEGAVVRRLVPMAALVIVWRAAQLLFDLPLPLVHPIVPLAVAVWAVWQIAGDPLAIETTAPELQKRGI